MPTLAEIDAAIARKSGAAAPAAPPVAPASESGTTPMMETGKQIGSGLVEGGIDYLTVPEMLVRGYPSRAVVNMGVRGAEYVGAISPETADAASDWLLPPPAITGDLATPYLAEPKEGYGGLRKASRFTGQGLTSAGVGGIAKQGVMAAAKSLFGNPWQTTKALASEAAYGTLGAGGDSAGRAIAESIDPESDMLANVFGIAGGIAGGTAPKIAGLGKAAATKHFLGDNRPDGKGGTIGKGQYLAAQRLGIEDKLPPATYGNSTMKTATQNIGMIPILGSRSAAAVEGMPTIMQERLGETTGGIRGNQNGPDFPNLPGNIQQFGDTVATGAERKASGVMQTVEEKIGGQRPVRIDNTKRTFTDVYNGDPADPASSAIPADLKPGVQQRERNLAKDTKHPVDSALHVKLLAKQAKLLNDLKAAKARLATAKGAATATNTAPSFHAQNRVDRITNDLATVDADIKDNLGPQFGQLKTWTGVNRTQANARPVPGGNIGLASNISGKLTDAGRNDLQIGADAAGHGPEYREARGVWDTVMDPETGAVPRIREGIPKGKSLPDGGTIPGGTAEGAHAWLTGKNMNYGERFQALQDSYDHAMSIAKTPEEAAGLTARWNQIRADLIDEMGRRNPGQVDQYSDFSNDTFSKNLEALDNPQSRSVLTGADPRVNQDLNDLGTIARANKATAREANSSKTWKHALMSSILGAGAGGAVANLASLPVLGPAGIAAAVTPLVTGKTLDVWATSPRTSRDLVFGALDPRRGKELLTRAARSGTSSMADSFGGPR